MSIANGWLLWHVTDSRRRGYDACNLQALPHFFFAFHRPSDVHSLTDTHALTSQLTLQLVHCYIWLPHTPLTRQVADKLKLTRVDIALLYLVFEFLDTCIHAIDEAIFAAWSNKGLQQFLVFESMDTYMQPFLQCEQRELLGVLLLEQGQGASPNSCQLADTLYSINPIGMKSCRGKQTILHDKLVSVSIYIYRPDVGLPADLYCALVVHQLCTHSCTRKYGHRIAPLKISYNMQRDFTVKSHNPSTLSDTHSQRARRAVWLRWTRKIDFLLSVKSIRPTPYIWN